MIVAMYLIPGFFSLKTWASVRYAYVIRPIQSFDRAVYVNPAKGRVGRREGRARASMSEFLTVDHLC